MRNEVANRVALRGGLPRKKQPALSVSPQLDDAAMVPSSVQTGYHGNRRFDSAVRTRTGRAVLASEEERIRMLTVTNTYLLNGLKDQNNTRIWSDFYARYQPLLVVFAKRLGLTEQDAQDAAQEALLAFVQTYREGAYDRDKGRLRTWLFGIATHKVRDIQRRRGKQLVIVDDADTTRFLNKIPDDRSLSEVWEAEWARAILTECMEQVRQKVKPQTMEAFELFALKGMPAAKVAQQLGMTENAVWIAKNRVVSHMRNMQEHLEENW